MMERERAYNEMLIALMEKGERLEKEEFERGLRLLSDLSDRMAVVTGKTEWAAHNAQRLQASAERAIKAFENRYLEGNEAFLEQCFLSGIDTVDGPLSAAGVRIAAPEISVSILELAQGYSADLITNLAEDSLKKINRELTLGLLGGASPYDTMKAIDVVLGTDSKKGVSYRAEAITRTEGARMRNNARYMRMQSAAGRTDPPIDAKKTWVHSGKTKAREHHKELDGESVGIDDDFEGGIPHPHAPGLSAEEVVN